MTTTQTDAELIASLGPMFAFGNAENANDLHFYLTHADQLGPRRRVIELGGMRLPLLQRRRRDDVFLDAAYQPVTWFAFGDPSPTDSHAALEVPGNAFRNFDDFVFRITPRSLVGFYVIDHRPVEWAVNQADRDGTPLTEIEYNSAMRECARTLLPLVEYAGLTASSPEASFRNPRYFVTRRLHVEELQLISGPWPFCGILSVIHSHSEEVRQMLEATIATWDSCDTAEVRRIASKNLADQLEEDAELVKAMLAVLQEHSPGTSFNLQGYCRNLVGVASYMKQQGRWFD